MGKAIARQLAAATTAREFILKKSRVAGSVQAFAQS
jgi:hypothetical protein